MRRVLVSSLVAAFLLVATAHPVHADRGQDGPGAFGDWFQSRKVGRVRLSESVAKTAQQYRYVFIAGFLNEGFQVGYYRENRRALLAAGVKKGAIHLIFPPSENGVMENVALLLREVPALAENGPEPLVLIGHSKGAVEALVFVLSAPEFVRARVKAVYLVQGAFGGSALADFVTGKGHVLDDRMTAGKRAQFAIAAAAGRLLDKHIDAGFQSLTHEHAAELWQRLIPPSGPGSALELKRDLDQKVFYIRSACKPEGTSLTLRLTATYLDTYYGPNDGLVEVHDQWVPGIGTAIALLDVDHTTLVISRPVNDQPPVSRTAFTEALLMHLSGAFEPTLQGPAIDHRP